MIQKAQLSDLAAVTALAGKLWPESSEEELAQQFRVLLAEPECALFLARTGAAAVGFAQCQLRRDYVEGTDSSPVGYLEGIYVENDFRGRGIARALLQACEAWASDMGCREFASDCELTNTDSLAFHLKAGFAEANRIICFTKKL